MLMDEHARRHRLLERYELSPAGWARAARHVCAHARGAQSPPAAAAVHDVTLCACRRQACMSRSRSALRGARALRHAARAPVLLEEAPLAAEAVRLQLRGISGSRSAAATSGTTRRTRQR